MSKGRKSSRKKHNAFILVEDLLMISVGIALAIFLVQTGVLDRALHSIQGYHALSSFFAGIFFTSAFTIAPSSIAFTHIAQDAPTSIVVIWGALGAMFGDLILLFFIRDRFADDLMKALKPKTVKYILKSLHLGFMRWLSPIIGAAIIASPLPDEFGITLLGMSKIKLGIFIPIALVMNALGIYLLIGFSNLL